MACAEGREGAKRFDVFGWMVGRCLWGPVDGREAPIGLRDWPDVVDSVGPAPYFAIDILVYPEAGKNKLGQ